MCPLAFSAGGGDPDGPGPGGGVGEPACGGKGGGREEEEEDEEEEDEEEEEEEEDEEEERHHSPVPVCACGPGNRRRPGLAPKRGSVTRSGACVLCRGPADRTGRGKDGASRTEHGSPVVETGVCPTGRGFGSRCDVRKPWPLKRAHAGAAAVQREISSGSSCPSSLCRTCPEPCGIVPDQGFGGKHPVPLPPRQVDPSPLDHQAGKSLHSLLKASTLKQSTSSSKHHWTITTERKETMTLQEAARVPVCEKRRSTLHDAIPFPGLIVQKLSHPKRGTAGYPSRVWDGGFPGGSVGNRPVPTQETRVSSPARDDPTCYRATKPIGLADGIRALDPGHCER
ncbi:hypothetical protein AB1E19_004657 [Capra hircus]